MQMLIIPSGWKLLLEHYYSVYVNSLSPFCITSKSCSKLTIHMILLIQQSPRKWDYIVSPILHWIFSFGLSVTNPHLCHITPLPLLLNYITTQRVVIHTPSSSIIKMMKTKQNLETSGRNSLFQPATIAALVHKQFALLNFFASLHLLIPPATK